MATGHTRLSRRGATYYHRAAIPKDIRDTYPKTEETFSLRTKDYDEALKRVRIAAVEVDQRFEEHRRQLVPRRTERARRENSPFSFSSLVTARTSSQDFPQAETVQTALTESQGELQKVEEKGGVRRTTTLRQVFEKYVEEREPHERTVNDYRAHMNRFLQVMGVRDIGLNKVTPAHIRKFKDAMIQYPARLPGKLKGKSVLQVLRATKGDTSIKRLTPKTINEKILTALRAIFGYALRNGYADSNPAQGISVEVSLRKKNEVGGQGRRRPYSVEDMNKIFGTFPVYTEEKRPVAGCGEAAYWLPLLAAFTGARLEELGQITRENIKRDKRSGVHYIDLTELAEAKNTNSRRKIPVHPELIALGFLEYVKTIQSGRIFPQLQRDNQGKLTSSFSKWWGRYARKHGGFDSTKVFHSFRHTAKDGFREGEVLEDLRDELMGHAPRTVGESYGAGSSVKRLAEGMSRLTYPGLKLEHLKASKSVEKM